jgi:hypothetical protein
MNAIFPIVGALAFGKIIFDIGDKAWELEQKAVHAAQAIKDAFEDIDAKARVTSDDLDIQNDKLQDEIDKLSGHPNNGLQTALDEARKMADKLLESLQADRKELAALLKEHEVSTLGSLLSGLAGTPVSPTGPQGKELLADQRKLTEQIAAATDEYNQALTKTTDRTALKAATDKKNEAVRAAYQSQIDAYKRESARLKKEQADSESDAQMAQGMGGQAAGLRGTPIDNSGKIENIEGRARELQRKLHDEAASESIASRTETVGQMKHDKPGKSGKTEDPNKDQLKQIEDDFVRLDAAKVAVSGEHLTAGDAASFWAQYLGTFEAKSEEAKKVLEEFARFQAENHKKLQESIAKYNTKQTEVDDGGQRALEKSSAAMAKWSSESSADILRTGAKWDEYFSQLAKGKEITAAIAEEISLTQLRALEASGGISHLGAVQVEAQMHAEQHRRALVALREELERLNKEAARDPLTGKVTDPKQAAKIAGVENQITQQKGKGSVQGAQDKAAIDAAIAKPYLDVFDHIDAGWKKVQNDLIAGNKNIAQDFVQTGMSLVQSGAAWMEEWLAKRAKTYIRDVVLRHTAEGQKAAADAAANATQTAALTSTYAAQTAAQTAALAAQTSAVVTAVTAQTAAQTAAAATTQAVVAASDVAKVISYAAVAGAAETAATLNPAAGMAMFAATVGTFGPLASFDVGTAYVPHDGLAMIHKGESILPPPQTHVLNDALNGGGGKGGGNTVNLNYNGQVNAFDRSGMRSTLKSHAEDILSIVREGIGRGSLSR